MEDCINSTGPIVKAKRVVAPFQNLTVKTDVDVEWTFSNENYVVVECGRNLIRKVLTESDGKTLTIENKNRCNWVRSYSNPMKVSVYSQSPARISILGYGDFKTLDTLKSSPLSIQAYGASRSKFLVNVNSINVDFAGINTCTIEGNAENSAYSIQNFGEFRAEKTKVKTLQLVMDGENNSWVWVEDSIKGLHKSPYNVFLKGNPTNLVNVKSSGKIVKD
jgi:hypothetical protein